MDGNCCCTVRGAINIDEYFHVRRIVRVGETISSHAYENRVGGKGANQAIAIVRAGGIVQFYGTIGKDGTWIKDSMMNSGIDVSGIIISDEPTGRAIIQVDDKNGENSIVLFPGANHSQLHETQFVKKSERWFPETTHVLLQNEIHIQSVHYALQNARNTTVILNPSPLPSADEIREFPWDKVDWLIINEAEAEGLYLSISGMGAPAPSMSTRELLILLSAQPLFEETNIVCTLGADGVLAFIPTFHRPITVGSFIYLPAARLQGEVRDSTGAGDCFTGYFVQGLMEFGPSAVVGKDIKELDIIRILKRSVYAAGMSVEKSGTIESIPERGEVEERMASSDE